MALTATQPFMMGKVRSRIKYTVANKTDIPKILLIKLGAVGDLVLASPFFDRLRNHFPHSEIVLVVGRSSYLAVENNPCIDRLILADDFVLYKGRLLTRSLELLRLVARLRKEDFDLAFVLHRAWPFNLLAYLTGTPVRVGFGRGREGVFLTHPTAVHRVQNERESYLDLLRTMDIPSVYKQTYFFLDQEEKDFLNLFLERYGIGSDEEMLAIAPGGGDNAKSSMVTKRWPMENYIGLIRRVQQEHPCRVVLCGGPGDRTITNSILESCPDCIDATDLSFGDMASLFRRCRAFVGNDSAPNHIASALGIPCIGIFGPTDPRQWAPPDSNSHVVIKPVECHPCFNDGKFPECSHIKCLTSITVDDVWQHLGPILSSPIQPRSSQV